MHRKLTGVYQQRESTKFRESGVTPEAGVNILKLEWSRSQKNLTLYTTDINNVYLTLITTL